MRGGNNNVFSATSSDASFMKGGNTNVFSATSTDASFMKGGNTNVFSATSTDASFMKGGNPNVFSATSSDASFMKGRNPNVFSATSSDASFMKGGNTNVFSATATDVQFIKDTHDKIKSISSIDAVGNATNVFNIINHIGGKGNTEMLQSMANLNKYIAKKANIKFPQAMKLSKHYREKAKEKINSSDIIKLNDEAMKIVDEDAKSGKIEKVVNDILGKQKRVRNLTKQISETSSSESDLSFVTSSS
jgi:hypothetical protein